MHIALTALATVAGNTDAAGVPTWVYVVGSLVMFGVSAGIAWGVSKTTQQTHGEAIKASSVRIDGLASDGRDRERRLTIVETKVDAMQDNHDELKADMKEGFAGVHAAIERSNESQREEARATRKDFHDLRDKLTAFTARKP